MPEFIRNSWYVVDWVTALRPGELLARQVIGDRLVLFRRSDGSAVAFEDRCPHRMAPLSAGRLEGDELRCMYHGLRYNGEGACVAVPGMEQVPPRLTVRVYPVVESGGWIWVWMGDRARADAALIPEIWGPHDRDYRLKSGALDYDADYQLVHDNLLDLSHLDFVHESTLGAATGGRWSEECPEVAPVPGGLYVWRWLRNAKPPYSPDRVDTHTSYRFLLPGVFLQRILVFPVGTAEHYFDGRNLPTPVAARVDQQAVTPVASNRSRYLFAVGTEAQYGDEALIARMYEGLLPAFSQDKAIIEAQARVLANTDPARRMAYIPQDQAPTMFRKLIDERRAAESS